MTKSFLTKKIFSIFAIFTFVLISTTTLAHAGVIQNIKYFLFGEPTVPTVTTTPITNPSINSGQAPSTSSGQTNTTVVVPPSTSGISENDIYLALTKISRLPDNIISQLRGPKGDTGPKGSSGLSTYSSTGTTTTTPVTNVYNTYTSSGGGSSSGSTYWKKDGHDIYYDKGNVGINTNTPDANLSIQSSDSVEKIVNGDFDTNANGWYLDTGWSYDSGKVTHSSGNTGTMAQQLDATAGKNYSYSFTVSGRTQGAICLYYDGQYITYSDADGVVSGTFTAQLTAENLFLDPESCTGDGGLFDGSIEDISVKEFASSLSVLQENGDEGVIVDGGGNLTVKNKLVVGDIGEQFTVQSFESYSELDMSGVDSGFHIETGGGETGLYLYGTGDLRIQAQTSNGNPLAPLNLSADQLNFEMTNATSFINPDGYFGMESAGGEVSLGSNADDATLYLSDTGTNNQALLYAYKLDVYNNSPTRGDFAFNMGTATFFNDTAITGSTNLIVKAGAGQSGNLFDVQNNSESSLFGVSNNGNVGIGVLDPTANLSIQSSASVEKVTNGTFAGSATGWTLGAGWAYDSGEITHTPGNTENAKPIISVTEGRNYLVSFDIIGTTQGSVCARYNGMASICPSSDATYAASFSAGSSGEFTFNPSSDFDGSIDNVSVEELSPSFVVSSPESSDVFTLDNAGNMRTLGGLSIGDLSGHYGGRLTEGLPRTFLDIESTFSDSAVGIINSLGIEDGGSGGLTGYSGSVSTVAGSSGNFYDLTGMLVTSNHVGSGTVDMSTGGNFNSNNFGSGIVTRGQAGYFMVYNAGTMTNSYGVYIDDVTSGTQTNQAYGLYQSDAEARNYFAGNLGIGNDSPSVALDVTGDIEYTGTITDVSDRRLKDNIQDYTGALDIISNLQAKSYNMISTPDKNEVGFIAQDVESIFPNATSIIDPEKGYLGVSYVSLVPVIAGAVKELNLKLIDINKIEEPNSIREAIVAWFSNIENGIGDMFANAFNAKEKICVDGECLTKDDVRSLLDMVHANNLPDGPKTPPTPDPTPSPDPIPTPDPEPTPDSSPEVTPPSDPVPEAVSPSDPVPETVSAQ